MDEYPIVTIHEATVDGRRCVSDEEDDRMLVDEEAYGFGEHPV